MTPLPVHRHLADQQAEARMDDLQREAEPAVRHSAWVTSARRAEPLRQEQAAAEQLQEVVPAAEDQRAFARMDGERHADAVADIFLKPGRAREALGRMHDLREAARRP